MHVRQARLVINRKYGLGLIILPRRYVLRFPRQLSCSAVGAIGFNLVASALSALRMGLNDCTLAVAWHCIFPIAIGHGSPRF